MVLRVLVTSSRLLKQPPECSRSLGWRVSPSAQLSGVLVGQLARDDAGANDDRYLHARDAVHFLR
jgi:hypothetical protein